MSNNESKFNIIGLYKQMHILHSIFNSYHIISTADWFSTSMRYYSFQFNRFFHNSWIFPSTRRGIPETGRDISLPLF